MSYRSFNRKMSVALWIFWAIIYVLAAIDCVGYGVAWHIILFSVYILCNLTGAAMAIRYDAYLEIRILHVSQAFIAANLAAHAYLLFRLPAEISIRNLLLIIIHAAWTLSRLVHIKELRKEAAGLKKAGVIE